MALFEPPKASVIYAQAAVFYNSHRITKIRSVSFTPEPGSAPIVTMIEGLDGFSPGAGMVNITVGFSVPAASTEFDFYNAMVNQDPVELQYARGNRAYAGVGKITAYEETQSDNATLEGTFTWQGPLENW